ncbi:hypothetical protein DXG01_002466, partial [Tephrocybe rancida]
MELNVACAEGRQPRAFIGGRRELGTSQENCTIAALAEALLRYRHVRQIRTHTRQQSSEECGSVLRWLHAGESCAHCPVSESSTLPPSSPSSPTAPAPMPTREPFQTLSSSDSSLSKSNSDSSDRLTNSGRVPEPRCGTRGSAILAGRTDEPHAPSRRPAPFARALDLSSA